MKRRLLMIAYHFPPLAGSSGIQRTLRFVQHLPRHGWEPIVLTANPISYDETNVDLLAEVPEHIRVERAFALNTQKHLSLFGRYPAALARPDRLLSWSWAAVPRGMNLIRHYKPAAIWSTYPIATAHLIGAALARRSGVPWIADFRDPMAQNGYPSDPETWKSFKKIETEAVARAAASVFTTPGAAEEYRRRYPEYAARIRVIENGYDESSFTDLDADGGPLVPGRITLLHSGVVYPTERDPRPLFDAMARLKAAGVLDASRFAIRFRAAAHDDMLEAEAAKRDIRDLIEMAPPVSYKEALAEMLRADGLLVMQGRGCNEQIPAKVYEYLRADRPIFALASGETGRLLHNNGVEGGAALEDGPGIEAALRAFVERMNAGTAPRPSAEAVRHHSREARAAELVSLLEEIGDAGSPGQ
jgi:glycosyltransferase involved in cell wall biosynthesis